MLDTVCFHFVAPLRAASRSATYHPVIRFGCEHYSQTLRKVTCSLPKLLWGHNGRLIATQAELTAALRFLWDAANAVATVPPLEQWTPKRLDLSCQFAGLDRAHVIDALASHIFPGVRKPPMHQAGHGVFWGRNSSRFGVLVYDKARQMRVNGDALRIEIKLAGNELRRLRGRDWRSFDQLWAAYREQVVKLPDLPALGDGKGWPEAVGRFVPQQLHEVVLAAVGLKERSHREARRRIRLGAGKFGKTLCFAELLPVSAPPPPVTVEPRSRTATGRPAHRP